MREILEAAQRWCPQEGDSLTGVVVRNMEAGAYLGRSILIRRDDGKHVLADAHAKEGHAVLGREWERQRVGPGQRVRIEFAGWRDTRDGGRRYRLYRVHLLHMAAKPASA